MISFIVPGSPTGKGRPRFNRKTGSTYTPAETASYENLVTMAARAAHTGDPLETPIAVRIDVYRPIPASWPKKRKAEARYDVRRPDVDNILKIIADAMNGVVYSDDAQISIVTVTKRFDAAPRVEVTVTALA